MALGAAILGADRAWIVPLTWTLLAWNLLAMPSPPPASANYRQMLTWMVQPPDTTLATTTALILGAAGVLAYALLGARP